MHISITEPLGRAYERLKAMLFQAFDLGKWLAVGLACWLARLTEGGFSGIPSGTANLDDDADATTLAGWDPTSAPSSCCRSTSSSAPTASSSWPS